MKKTIAILLLALSAVAVADQLITTTTADGRVIRCWLSPDGRLWGCH